MDHVSLPLHISLRDVEPPLPRLGVCVFDSIYDPQQHPVKLTFHLLPILVVNSRSPVAAPSVAYQPGHAALETHLRLREPDRPLYVLAFPFRLDAIFRQATVDRVRAVPPLTVTYHANVLLTRQSLTQIFVPYSAILRLNQSSFVRLYPFPLCSFERPICA